MSTHLVMNHIEPSMACVAFKNLVANELCLVFQKVKCLLTKASASASFVSLDMLNPKGIPTYLVASPSSNHFTPKFSPHVKFLGVLEA